MSLPTDPQRSPLPYADRRAAGRRLAEDLSILRGRDDVVVLALPRGGVPVACEVAAALGAPLDVLIVRKLGCPGQPELALGAIASGGVVVRNAALLAVLPDAEAQFARLIDRESGELARREVVYRGGRPSAILRDRTVVLVDDGLATGATMRAAIGAVATARPRAIIVAVPAAAPDAVAEVAALADVVICPATPPVFSSLGACYRDFRQTDDAEVIALLEAHRRDQEQRTRPPTAD